MNDLPVFTPTTGGLLSLAVTFLLPLVVGLVTKQSWSPTAKGVILLAVAFVKTVLEAWLASIAAGIHFDLVGVLYSTLVNFLIAVAAYFGLLKDTPLAIAAQRSLVKDAPIPSTPEIPDRVAALAATYDPQHDEQ